MVTYVTRFGSLDQYEKGGVEVIDDDPKRYVFSNVFDVASRSRPWERVCVAKNFEYVIAKHGSDVDPTVLDDFMTQLVRIHEAESRRWREIRGPRWPASQPAAAPSHQPAGNETA